MVSNTMNTIVVLLVLVLEDPTMILLVKDHVREGKKLQNKGEYVVNFEVDHLKQKMMKI